MMKKAPRSTLNAMIKPKLKRNLKLKIATDAMVELAVRMFLNSVAEEARMRAFEDKSATIRAHHVVKVAERMLRKARG
ncbi:centromere protein W [Lampris incognitus]|uniref:centromere protein W n=1 Tax=Lampris incognitus TaxID=2546036 RepID=UPI0024B57631|nr:centromere protein W [Lampris incognitus]